MKAKRILITYLDNGNLQSQVAKEMMFNRILEDMISEGREVKSSILQPKSKSVLFDDGSKVMLFPFSSSNTGLRVTHVFVDEEIALLPNGKQFVNEVIKPSLLKGEFENFDTSGKQFSFFSFNNGELKTN